MINPQPVNDKRSPYHPSRRDRTAYPKQMHGLPKPLATEGSGLKGKRKGPKRLVLGILTVMAVAFGTYAFAQISMLKKDITVEHEGTTSAILDYSEGKNLDANLFKKPGSGRFNVVLLGIGGENHPGGTLTDSIQVASVDTINKKIGFTSVPRDLYVMVPGKGRTKINEAYSTGERSKKGGGGLIVRQILENVTGAPISNFVVIDFAGAKELIDQLGGIDVNVPKALNDPLYPDERQIGYSPFSVRAGMQHMNGSTALKYARSRETTSDFDRSARQQIIMDAIKDKALSMGVLTNPMKVNGMMGVLGKHLQTDLTIDQVRALIAIYKDAGDSNHAVLDTSDKLGLLQSGSDAGGRYINYPVLGYDRFEAIHQWFGKNNPDPLIPKEGATVTVTASSKATKAQTDAFMARLKDYGFTVSLSTEPTTKTVSSTTLYTKGNDKPITKNYLSSILDTTAIKGTPLDSGSDFEIIYVPTTPTKKK